PWGRPGLGPGGGGAASPPPPGGGSEGAGGRSDPTSGSSERSGAERTREEGARLQPGSSERAERREGGSPTGRGRDASGQSPPVAARGLVAPRPAPPRPSRSRSRGSRAAGGRASSGRAMPIEIVCKIQFAEPEPEEKPAAKAEAGDQESLLRESGSSRLRRRDLAAFAGGSTLHGLGHICRAGRLGVRQSLWAVALVAALVAFLSQAARSALLYLEHPHLTALDQEAARQLGFPAVTICNINRFRHSALTDADIFHLANMTGLPPKDRDGHKATDLLYPDPDMADILNRTGHQLHEMLKSCNFSGENCSAQNFTVVYTRYGKCYTFNADPSNLRVTRQGGMGNGLEIMLDIQQEEYLPIWSETNETSFEAGLRVQIHSQDEPPYIHQLGFGVSPGFQTFVSCQEQRLTYLPQPWGNCRASVKVEQLLPGYESYSIAACRLQCEKEAVVQKCECRMVHMPGERGPAPCPAPPPLHGAGLGGRRRLSLHTPPPRRENFLVLDIFFEALNYEAIEQKKAYELSGLLGDIGGQMGLFIGASILTVLEILDYIYEVSAWRGDKVSRTLRRSKAPLKKPSGSVATLGLEETKEQVCPPGHRGGGAPGGERLWGSRARPGRGVSEGAPGRERLWGSRARPWGHQAERGSG
uniref:Acid sensing ion channel subunit family member 4 n=1 Tax=Sphenodon punctatus TaxID=8508 RepID=A0A8D0GK74_SPHPU